MDSGTISSSTRTSSAVSVVAGRSSQATGGRKHRTARLAGATIRLATMRGVLSGKRRRGRRWGSRAEPFRSERSRRMRGADVAPCGPVPTRRRRWSRICTRPMRRRRELRRHALDDDCPGSSSTARLSQRFGNGLTKQANSAARYCSPVGRCASKMVGVRTCRRAAARSSCDIAQHSFPIIDLWSPTRSTRRAAPGQVGRVFRDFDQTRRAFREQSADDSPFLIVELDFQ